MRTKTGWDTIRPSYCFPSARSATIRVLRVGVPTSNLRKLIAYSKFHAREMTLEVARDALRDLLRVQNRAISIENIQKTVADFYRVKVPELFSKKISILTGTLLVYRRYISVTRALPTRSLTIR